MQLKSLLILAFLVIPFSDVWAQNKSYKMGYVVTTSNDTIRGLIKDAGDYQNSIAVKFKPAENSEVKTYSPQELKAYFISKGSRNATGEELPSVEQFVFTDVVPPQQAANIAISNHKSYVSVQLTGSAPRHVFLREVVRGPAKLFFGKSIDKKEAFFIQKGENAIHELSKANYLGLLQNILSGCDKINFNNKGQANRNYMLTLTSLTKLVTSYNLCTAPDARTTINVYDAKVATKFGIKAGLNNCKIKYSEHYRNSLNPFTPTSPDTEYKYRMGYALGFFMNFNFNGRFSLQPELLYSQKGGEATQEIVRGSNQGEKNFYENKFKLGYIQIPILLQYNVKSKFWQPFISLGPSIGREVNFTIEQRNYTDSGKNPSIVMDPIRLDKLEIGGIVGLGIKRNILKSHMLLLELRYDYSSIRLLPNSQISSQTLQLQTGISF